MTSKSELDYQRLAFCNDIWTGLERLGLRAESQVRCLHRHSVVWADNGTLHSLVAEDFSPSSYPGVTRIYVNIGRATGWRRCEPSGTLLVRLNLPPFPQHPVTHAEISMLHEELPGWAPWLVNLFGGKSDSIPCPPGCTGRRPQWQPDTWPKSRVDALSFIRYCWTDAAERLADELNEKRGVAKKRWALRRELRREASNA